jgi:hypothetical protein
MVADSCPDLGRFRFRNETPMFGVQTNFSRQLAHAAERTQFASPVPRFHICRNGTSSTKGGCSRTTGSFTANAFPIPYFADCRAVEQSTMRWYQAAFPAVSRWISLPRRTDLAVLTSANRSVSSSVIMGWVSTVTGIAFRRLFFRFVRKKVML